MPNTSNKSDLNKIAIEINSLRKSYPGTLAVDDLSLKVKHGTIHGFLGPNGAGKSTTMKALCGLHKFDSGEIKIYGKPLQAIKKDLFQLIGFLPENPPLYEHMRVREFISFVYKIYSKDKENEKQMVDLAIKRCGLFAVENKFISQLSKGFKQRTGLAMSMVYGPSILILDEPFVGLDPIALGELRKVLLELKKDHTILFSSHQLDEVQRLCESLTVIDQGKTIFNGPIELFNKDKTAGKTIRVTTLKWNQEVYRLMREQLPEVRVRGVESRENRTYISIQVQDEANKIAISEFLAAQMVPVIEFKEESKDLEENYQQQIIENQTQQIDGGVQ